ncbi:MAG: hypothetical protein IPN58_19975 [Anaerolineales bacterium]|nr:hypothetical protein [Anaerolineales bacterium]
MYREILLRRGAARRAAREAAFVRRLGGLGCRVPGPCRIDREQLGVLAPLGAGFAPEQWARLAAALTEGELDPLAVWRDIERENLAEAIAVREAAFLRYMGAWGHAPHWNPLDWTRTAPRLGRVLLDQETAGLIDDLGSALGSLGGEGGGDALSTVSQGIGALFGGGDGGPQGANNPLGGKLGAFAEQAVGVLTGRKSSTQPKAGPSAGHAEAAAPVDDSETAAVLAIVDQGLGAVLGGEGAPKATSATEIVGKVGGLAEQALGGLTDRKEPAAAPTTVFDLQRGLAQWVGQGRLGERVVRGLAGVGLIDVAAALPQELLRVTAGHAPRAPEPSEWWHELTTGQGLDEKAEAALRSAIDADGPDGARQTIATYARLLEEAARAQMAQREALFTKILAAAQRTAGPAFDPAHLPGGDPFVLLSRHVRGWPRVGEAMKRGDNPLGVFQQVEGERLNRLLQVDAREWKGRMLAALWDQREEAGWIPAEAGAADDAGDEAGDADEADVGVLEGVDAGFPEDDAGDADGEGEAGDADDAGDFDDAGDLDDAGDIEAGDADDAGDFEGEAGDIDDAGDFDDAVDLEDEAGDLDDAGDSDERDAADPRPARPQPGRDRPPARPEPGRDRPPARPEPGRDRPLTRPPHGPPPHAAPRVPIRGPVRPIHREPIRVIHRGPVRVIHREPVRVIRDIVRAPMTRELVRFFDPFRDLLWRRRQRAILPAPVRPRLPPPLARFVSGNARRAPAWWPFLRNRRPRPLYHMSFARPMSQRELHRLLMFVPQLRAHPEGVLAEMAGLVGQARDVRGVDATTASTCCCLARR